MADDLPPPFRLPDSRNPGSGVSVRKSVALQEGSSDTRGDGRRSRESQILKVAYRLVTANLWLRTAILAGVSVALIVLAFHWHVTSPRSGVLAFLAAQLGTGLLVVAVGAALVQGFIMSAPQAWRKLLDELRFDAHADGQGNVADKVTALENLTGDGIRTIEARLAGLAADLETHDRRTRNIAEDVFSQAGVDRLYSVREDATADIAAALRDPRVSEIRVLGVGLSDWFRGRRNASGIDPLGRLLERLVLGEESGVRRGKAVSVQVLLLDPGSAAARLLTHGVDNQRDERLKSLRRDVLATADQLRLLGDQVTGRGNGNSLEVRLYRASPAFFAFSTDVGSFVRPYYAGWSSGPSPAPMFYYADTSSAHKAVRQHFNAIWQNSSVRAEELLVEKAYGVDQGISASEICNIYTDLAHAQERISWLVDNATRRVWIQGVSLVHHLSPPLEKSIHDLFGRPSVDARLLILDPECEQAYFKSFRDYLLDRDAQADNLDYQTYLSQKSLHRESAVYTNIMHSTRRLQSMTGTRGADRFQLRHYICAPTSYILIADDHALVEQFHYGKPPSATDSTQAQLQLAREMPLVEYWHPQSPSSSSRSELDPVSVIEDHFSQVYYHFSHVPVR